MHTTPFNPSEHFNQPGKPEKKPWSIKTKALTFIGGAALASIVTGTILEANSTPLTHDTVAENHERGQASAPDHAVTKIPTEHGAAPTLPEAIAYSDEQASELADLGDGLRRGGALILAGAVALGYATSRSGHGEQH